MRLTECNIARQHQSVRALIVDDSQFVLSQLRSFLNCCVRIIVIATAENGQQALDLVRLHRPELVLLDLQMPGMNGFEAAARITREFPDTRVVHITTHGGPDIEPASRQSGAQFLLPKTEFVSRFCEVFQQLFGGCVSADAESVTQAEV
jgi:DNA-binding NarL/FixJ family response regulator